eukprot:TRINITY_DN4652_c0_g1_i15.p1 TRINITY_DN4652_c0_g1~~TRINITY_DN4652_c0_g1_i15.p1  ORF type:complete len:150 (+),score=26.97 TRINITY_DN4652_c0_g1_i15:242-691(+)
MILQRLISRYDCYLITEVSSDKEEKELYQILKDNLSKCDGFNPIKLLFCSSAIGRVHMVKHLSVDMHIDCNRDVLRELAYPKPLKQIFHPLPISAPVQLPTEPLTQSTDEETDFLFSSFTTNIPQNRITLEKKKCFFQLNNFSEVFVHL